MRIDLFEERERRRAKKEYEKNQSKINGLDNICTSIEELIYQINEVDSEYKDKYPIQLRAMEDDFIAEMRYYEDENLDIKERWEEI